jgi:lysine 2,3-aminomutase
MVEDWQKILYESITKPEQLQKKFSVDTKSLNAVVDKYPMKISKYYFNLIEEPEDPIWKQCVPNPLELKDYWGCEDPLNEEGDSPTPGLIHRYPDRVLMYVSNTCGMFCRFCTRKRKVGKPDFNLNNGILMKQIRYIQRNPAIRDVLLSGGDPLLLPDDKIEFLLKSLRAIPHVEIVRIGTRAPCTLPQRVTPELCSMLRKYHPLYVNVHFNHPREITEESRRACGMLADAGIPLGNQSVLLRGVNDNPETMKSLVQKLLTMRVKPYYLFQMDLVKGTAHFRTKVETGLKIIESLTGHTSGFAVPRFVIDAPGGGGKIPVQPNYLIKIQSDKVILRNYKGKQYVYPQIPQDDMVLTPPIEVPIEVP